MKNSVWPDSFRKPFQMAFIPTSCISEFISVLYVGFIFHLAYNTFFLPESSCLAPFYTPGSTLRFSYGLFTQSATCK